MTSKRGSSLVYLLVVIFLAILWSQLTKIDVGPVIHTSSGDLQGFKSFSRQGREYYSYLGIKYAEPPIGNLRFESPLPVKPWNGTFTASKFGPACKGFDFIFSGRIQGVEDCLSLNIFSPKRSDSSKPLPVLVFIHGGAFHTGSAHEFPGKFFMDEDIVFVTVQYRLGIFGFLSTDDSVIKGNMGMKDVVLSLKWIQQNIDQFNGDKNRVTIFGESAGAGTVSMLMLSPLAKGTFQKVISMSCESLSDLWQLGRNMTQHLELAAPVLDCPLETTKIFSDCLKSKDPDELVRYHFGMQSIENFKNPYGFGPSIEHHNDSDDAFLTENPLTLLESGRVVSKVPWMVGVNENEGLIITAKLLQFPEFAKNLSQNDDFWNERLGNVILYDSKSRQDAARKIKNEYFGQRSSIDLSGSSHEDILRFSQILTDKIFYKPMEQSALLQSTVSPVYAYVYKLKSTISLFHPIKWADTQSVIPSELLVAFRFLKDRVTKYLFWEPSHRFGPSHADALPLLFNINFVLESVINFFDYDASRFFVKTIADFVQHEDVVTVGNVTWPAVKSSELLKVMELTSDGARIVQDPFKRLKFWKELDLPPI